MTIYEYGNPDADTVLIQLTGDHELSVLKNEVKICGGCSKESRR